MGQPAARVGDLTAHGAPLMGAGCPSVLIEGRPAWRITDFQACSLANGPQPHVGGVVSRGSATVLVCGLPAVRLGDSIPEPGGPNAIVQGAAMVLIG